MKNIVCVLDCSKWKETFELYKLESYKKIITAEIYKAHDKVKPGDVLTFQIVAMQDMLLHHVWCEINYMRPCDVVIDLKNISSESGILFILNAVLSLKARFDNEDIERQQGILEAEACNTEKANELKKYKHLEIREIHIGKITSQFPDVSQILIENYCAALNSAKIITTLKLDDKILNDEKKEMEVVSPTSSPVSVNGFFAKPPEFVTDAPIVVSNSTLVV